MTRSEIDNEIKNLDPNVVKHSDEHWGYRFLLTAPVVGPFYSSNIEVNINRIAAFWGICQTNKRRTLIRRGFRNKIWHYGLGKHKFLDSEVYDDGIGLGLGCAVLSGYIKRVK